MKNDKKKTGNANETPHEEVTNGSGDAVIVEDSQVETAECKQGQDAIVAELTDRLQRTMADFDNYRKRTLKERANMREDGVRDVVEKLLPVFDNFERAMLASTNTEDNFYKGVQLIFKQIANELTELGIEEIPAMGESFNPEVHYAVAHVDDAQFGEDEVIEVLQKGYKYRDKIIRPSMVRVAN